MARIISFSKGDGKVSSRISDVECIFNTGIVDGEKYIVFSTYGSSDRKDTSKVSQVLHIDRQSAEQMMKIIKKEFNL